MQAQPTAKDMSIEYKKQRTRQVRQMLVLATLALSVIILPNVSTWPMLGIPTDAAYVVAAGLVAMLFVVSMSGWRCPSCHKYLGLTHNPRFCGRCGTKVR